MAGIIKRLRRLRKNTALTIGIIGCSFFISFSNLYAGTGITPATQTAQAARSYEIQFHTIKLHGQLDYNRLNRMGITKVIYRVFVADENEGGLYFNNSQFNTLQPALEKLIAEFDFKKLNLCAWMMTRKFNWLNNTSLFDYQYENDYLQMIPKLDVFNPDAVRKLIAVYKELASRHIDCILIQDDFTLRYNEGFSSWGKAQFTSAVRAPAVEKLMMADGTPYNQAWKRVKADQLNKVLKVLVENCKMVNSAIKVGINIYYETPAFPDKAETWYGHSLKAILDTGVDYIYLMSYQRQIKDEMNWDEERNRAFFKEMVEKAFDMCKEKLVVKLQIRDWKTAERIPAAEVRTYLDLIPSRVDRVCFTPVKIEDYDYLEELIGGAAKK